MVLCSRDFGKFNVRCPVKYRQACFKQQQFVDKKAVQTQQVANSPTIKRLGRAIWKRWSGYHQRNLIETAMHRFKRLGERLHARKPAQQAAEVHVRCAIINLWTHLGMPVTVPCP